MGYATVRRDESLFQILLEGMAGVRYKACGGAKIRVAQRTLAAIETEGLAFFDQALTPRGHAKADPRPLGEYLPWHETPLAPAWTNQGYWRGLHCMEGASEAGSIFEASRVPGSYYTTLGGGALLLVIPRLKLAVFTFYGI